MSPAEPPAVRGVRFRIPSLHAEPRRDEARPPRESGSLAQAAQHSGQGCILCNLRRDPLCWRSKAVYALLWWPVHSKPPRAPAGRPVRCRRVDTQTVNSAGLDFGCILRAGSRSPPPAGKRVCPHPRLRSRPAFPAPRKLTNLNAADFGRAVHQIKRAQLSLRPKSCPATHGGLGG